MAAQRDNFPITSFGLPTRSPPVKSQVVAHTLLMVTTSQETTKFIPFGH
jgi:hypothetical protein